LFSGLCVVISQASLPEGLRVAWGGLAATVGLVGFVGFVGWALKAARSHVDVTIDDEVLTVREIGLLLTRKRVWPRRELRLITFGIGRGLRVLTTAGKVEAILSDLELSSRQDVLVALRVRLGMSAWFSSSEVFGELAPMMDALLAEARGGKQASSACPPATMAIPIRDPLIAAQGGFIEMPLSEDLGGGVARVKIPPGVRDGQKVRLRGVGRHGQDLIIGLHLLLPGSSEKAEPGAAPEPTGS